MIEPDNCPVRDPKLLGQSRNNGLETKWCSTFVSEHPGDKVRVPDSFPAR
jgi:hypothetical protein